MEAQEFVGPVEVNVTVAVRLRPPVTTPEETTEEPCAVIPGPYINCLTVDNARIFRFDNVQPMECSQSHFFSSAVQPLIPYFLEGYDVTVIAYGQAGSGKSYTILGPGPHCALSELEYGTVPRATREIFNRMKLFPDRKFRVFVTFVEIYQEVLRDLLSPTGHSNLHIREHPQLGMKVEGAEHVECQSTMEVLNCMIAGMNNRQQGEHAHTIFSLVLEQHIYQAGEAAQQKVSQFLAVDLAGSERLCSEGSVRLDSSLASLGNLIHALAAYQSYMTHAGSPHHSQLPYKDSKLTHMLKGSLGGRSITLFICCVSPLQSDLSDTINTLNCGHLMKVVKNRPTLNMFIGQPPSSLYEEMRTRSVSDNMFGMEFVMHQWKKLVSDAEGLFHHIAEGQGLTEEDLEHIQRWLCLKQECEEIVASQQADSFSQLLPRSLDVIGELSESEEKVEDEDEEASSEDGAESTSEDVDEAKTSSVSEESLVKSYRSTTQSDVETDGKRMNTPEFLGNLDSLMVQFQAKTDVLIQHWEQNESNQLAATIPADEAANQPGTSTKPSGNSGVPGAQLVVRRNSIQPDSAASNAVGALLEGNQKEAPKPAAVIDHGDNKQNQMKHVMLDLQGVNGKINELAQTIQLKEEMLAALVSNSEVRLAAKQRLERKLRTTQEAYRNSQLKLAQAERLLQHQTRSSPKLNQDVEKYRLAAQTYKQRLRDLASIQHLAEDSSEKLVELEHSLEASRRQLEKLKRQLRREERLKSSVERELQKEQLQLAIKQAEQAQDVSSRSVDTASTTSSDKSSNEPLTSSQEGSKLELKPVGLHDTKEGSLLRRAIRKLRRTKDGLISQRYELNTKFKVEKVLSPEEERKMLEIEEAIEAIDAAIEHKNELLCGRPEDLLTTTPDKDSPEGELIERLAGLSLNETKMLLYKYFHKVVDLRDSSRKLEVQVAEHESMAELHMWRFQALGHALQQARYATERQLVAQQRSHDEQIHLLLRHCAEESGTEGGGSSTSSGNVVAPAYRQDVELRRENKILRRRLEEAHLVVHTHSSGRRDAPSTNAVALPEAIRRRHAGGASGGIAPATRITRAKNKLVIQQLRGNAKSPG